MQKCETRMVPELEGLDYEERLKIQQFPPLKTRRERGDFILIYKILNIPTDVDKDRFLIARVENWGTKMETQKVNNGEGRKDVFFFCNKRIDSWNL